MDLLNPFYDLRGELLKPFHAEDFRNNLPEDLHFEVKEPYDWSLGDGDMIGLEGILYDNKFWLG